MRLRVSIIFFVSFFCWSFNGFSTHIVGGSITYVHIVDSTYTVTLKLYRDCSPGTTVLPDSVIISVVGFDGAPFSPSKDIVIQLGTVTPVPSNLDSCASAPNPMPCTQEAVYSKTVNNLPPNPGGYHLYFQYIARNFSLTNVNSAGTGVGESFYAYIPGTPVLWGEDFNLNNGTVVDNGATAWTSGAGITAPSSAMVRNSRFEIRGANSGQQTWTSQIIPIAAFTSGVNLSVNLSEAGNLDATDSIFVYYRLNGGVLIPFAINGSITDDFNTASALQNSLIGNSIQIIVQIKFDSNSPNSEIYHIDEVLVGGSSFISNSNPKFNLFPPLFLCVGTPFTFNHAASDLDGDSLSYAFYTPFDGDVGPGPKDPSFPNNTATFPPITFLPGFTATNPLGGTPLSLNAATGMLSGTPAALGQYVVGILVKEFRNGVYLSSTYRDFQFNVITCPQFAPAQLTPIVSCNGNTISFSNSGGGSGSGWLWNFGDPTTLADSSKLNTPSYTYPLAGNYTVTLTTGVGTPCSNTASAQLTISSVVPNFTSTAPHCAGTSIAFTDQTIHSSNTTPNSWRWKFGDGGTSILQNPSHTYNSGGTYVVTLYVGSSTNCTDSVSLPITIYTIPSANSVNAINLCAGAISLVIQLTSVPAGASFVWTNSNTGIGLSASGIGNVPSFTATNSGNTASLATVQVTPMLNSCPGNPINFTVNVSPQPVLSAIPSQTVCSGTQVSASNWLSNPSTTFEWTNSNTAIGLASNGVGNTPTFTASNLSANPINATISVKPILNSCQGNSENFVITIKPSPSMINPSNQIACPGSLLTSVSFASTPNGASFAWTNSNPTLGLAANGNGMVPAFTTINSDTLPLVSTVAVSPILNGCVGSPANYTITVNPKPQFTTPINQSFCAGDVISGFNFASKPSASLLSWTNNNAATGLPSSGQGNIPTFIATNSGTSMLNSMLSISIQLNGCFGNAQTFTISVKPLPSLPLQNHQTVCAGGMVPSTAILTNPSGALVNWTNNNMTIGLGANGVGDIPSFIANNSTQNILNASINLTPQLNGCTGNTINYNLSIKPLPTAIPFTNYTYCDQTVIALAPFSSIPAGANFLWSNSNTSIGLLAGGSGNISPFTAANNGSTAIAGTISVFPELDGCAGDSIEFNITVQPKAQAIVPSDINVCSGETLPLLGFSSNPALATFTWTNTNASIGIASNGTGFLPAFTAQNNSGFAQSATLTVTPSFQTCKGFPASFKINVFPKPIADFNYSPYPTSILNPTIYFSQLSQNASSYQWDFGNGNTTLEANPIHTFTDTGCVDVELMVSSSKGCANKISKQVCVEGDFVVYIPNAFTPDGDGINDTFFPKGYGISALDYELTIFDRWGLLLFKSNLLEKGWNGSSNNLLSNGVSPIDTYIYKLHCTDYKAQGHDFIGHVNLVR